MIDRRHVIIIVVTCAALHLLVAHFGLPTTAFVRQKSKPASNSLVEPLLQITTNASTLVARSKARLSVHMNAARKTLVMAASGNARQRIRRVNDAMKQRSKTAAAKSFTESASQTNQNTNISSFQIEARRTSRLSIRKTAARNTLIVDASGNFSERIRRFNDAVDQLRSELLLIDNRTKSGVFRWLLTHMKYRRIRAKDDEYLNALASYPQVKTLILPWRTAAKEAMRMNANVLLPTYYPISGTRQFCGMLDHSHILPGVYVYVFRKMYCTTNITKSVMPGQLNYGHLKDNTGKKRTAAFYREPPTTLLHLHVLSGAVVSTLGQITTADTHIFVDYCSRRHYVQLLTSKILQSAPFVDELFAITHPAGTAVYHGIVEEIPRIAPFVEFLQRHPKIRIHLSDGSHPAAFLRVFGLNPARAVHGLVGARVVYVPRAPACMMPRLVETQLLSQRCHDYIRRNFGERPRNRVVLIQRTGKRRFSSREEVERKVRKASVKSGLRFTSFRDDPVPSFNDTMKIFYEAVMVVAAHGAGLSNLIFCRPGTIVIEFVPKSFITPFCFLQLAHVLGHRWHGIGTRRSSGSIGVDVVALYHTVLKYLKLRKEPHFRYH